MTYNVQGLLLCWYSAFLQPELSLIKVTEVENMMCCWVLFGQPGLKLIRVNVDQDIFVSQHSRKLDVVRCH
jgi:hypothetical protein